MSTVNDIIQRVFCIPPKPPMSFNLELDNSTSTLFQILMSILVRGAKVLYGDSLTLDNITEQQFKTINECMQSLGYTVKYETLFDEQDKTKLKGVNIWFVHYIHNINCHGIRKR
jgi:hypothetical protein